GGDVGGGGERGVEGGAGVGQLPAELERGLLAVEELGERPGELVERRGPTGGVVDARGGEHRGEDLQALLGQEPLVAREGCRPVDVGLRVPLAALAALVEGAELLDLAGIAPGPVEIDRYVDVDLVPQLGDALLVDLDELEVPQPSTVFREELFHGSSLSVPCWPPGRSAGGRAARACAAAPRPDRRCPCPAPPRRTPRTRRGRP